MKLQFDKQKLLPFILTALVVLLDQLTKAFIVRNWPREGTFIKDLFGNGLVQFYHVRNRAIAFSLGDGLPDNLRPILFIILPVIILGFLLWYYFKSVEFRTPQRVAVAGIIGGGMGNIIDRIFRPDGVVDFVSVRFFGFQSLKGPLEFLSWERWPTFNIADATVVICCFVLFISIFFGDREPVKNGAPAGILSKRGES
jgi:signal peptidase II